MKFLFLTAVLFLTSTEVWAHKLNLDLGYYTINADPPAGSGLASISLSGLGTYSLSGSFEVLPSLEIGAGYTVFFAKLISGDMGFGPDFSVIYFPFTRAGAYKTDVPGIQYSEIEQLRPFAYAAFHQRQFQSTQSAFSGFGEGVGLEYQYDRTTSFRGTIRSMNLSGPSEAKFNYLDVIFGLQLHF